MATVTAAGMGFSVTQFVTIIGVIVAVITALIFDWPARVWKAVLRWRGQRPIAVNNERPDLEPDWPQGPITLPDDPKREGARSVVLHLYNHADHPRHVIVREDSEVHGPAAARLVGRSFWIPGHTGMNVAFTLTAPRYSWADAPVVQLRLKGSTDAGERIRWRGNVAPRPYNYSGFFVGFA
jgi:hypothetical protein